MEDSIGVYEAKTHLTRLLDRVADGERITITRHGVPIAVLNPYDPDKSAEVTGVIAEIRAFRRQNRLDGLSIRELIDEGRR